MGFRSAGVAARPWAGVLLALAVAVTISGPAAAADEDGEGSAGRCDAAPVMDATGATLRGRLGTEGDVDWYRFEVLAPPVGGERLVRLLLGRLPADYRLDVYDDCGKRLAGSDRSGRQFEEVSLHRPASVLAVRVSSRSDASSTKPYELQYDTYGPGMVIGRLLLRAGDERLSVGTLVINNTDSPRRDIVVRFRHARRCGRSCVSFDGPVHRMTVARLAPGQTVPVVLRRALPDRYAGTRVEVESAAVDAGLRVRPLPVWVPTTQVRDGRRTYGGVVENPSGGRVHDVLVTVAAYDRRGRVRDAATVAVADEMSTSDRVPFQIERRRRRGEAHHRITADGLAG